MVIVKYKEQKRNLSFLKRKGEKNGWIDGIFSIIERVAKCVKTASSKAFETVKYSV